MHCEVSGCLLCGNIAVYSPVVADGIQCVIYLYEGRSVYCSRIVGHVKCDYSSPSDRDCYIRVFHPFGGLPLVSLPFEPVFSLFFTVRRIFPLVHLARFERVALRIHSAPASLILKIGGQWRVNLRETHTRTVKDSKRYSPGYSALFTDERCEN